MSNRTRSFRDNNRQRCKPLGIECQYRISFKEPGEHNTISKTSRRGSGNDTRINRCDWLSWSSLDWCCWRSTNWSSQGQIANAGFGAAIDGGTGS